MENIMTDLIVNKNCSLQEKCKEFGKALGIDRPIPEQALIALLNDENYSHNLLVSRRFPKMMNYLLENPPLVEDIKNGEKIMVNNSKTKTNRELLVKATKALINWSKTGFSVVDNEILERRENACLACSNLSDPEKTLQKIIPSKKVNGKIGERTGKKVCKLCGCNVGKKMCLTSESCPDKHPEKEGMTRWEEPIPEDVQKN